MGLEVNQDKTKYLVTTRGTRDISDLVVENYTFQQVENFKYLGSNINQYNNMHNEIKIRISVANKGYYALKKLFKSKFLSRQSKERLYLSFLRPVLTFACETWSTTKGDEEKMAYFERRVLRRIYGPILENEVYRRRTNKEVQQIYQKPGINAYLMSKRIEWAGHVWRSNGILKKALEGKINGKRPRGRPRQRWIDRVKEDIDKCAQGLTLEDSVDRDSWRKVAEAAKVLQGHCKSTSTHLKLKPNTPENYRKIIHFLNENEAQFHTYQLQSDKAFRVVISNLHSSTLVFEISSALEEIGHSVRKVTNILHYQTKNPLPLFFVDLEPDENNNDVFDITSILHTKIKIEESHKQRQIPQCIKCQSYGHTKSYCSHSPRCVKCGGDHFTASCTKSRESPAICALCSGNHPANYKGCTIYKELQQRRRHPSNTKQTSQQQQYQHLNTQPSNQPTNPPPTNTRDRSCANVTGNDTSQNKNADSPSSNNLENVISKFLDDFKSMINPLLALLTTVTSKLSIKND
ncbi:hypothetical protein QTP88_024426 [Uroleucon formosanum]